MRGNICKLHKGLVSRIYKGPRVSIFIIWRTLKLENEEQYNLKAGKRQTFHPRGYISGK